MNAEGDRLADAVGPERDAELTGWVMQHPLGSLYEADDGTVRILVDASGADYDFLAQFVGSHPDCSYADIRYVEYLAKQMLAAPARRREMVRP